MNYPIRMRIIILIITLLIIVLSLSINRTRVFIETIYFDMTHDNKDIHSKEDLLEILNGFEMVKRDKLPKEYLKSSKMGMDKYSRMTQRMTFYKITKKDTYKKIVGNLRIKNFVSRDYMYYNASYQSDDVIYWGIKKEILFKLLELKNILEKRNYNFYNIKINSGHRTPYKNEKVGGASKSRHIVGEAIDLKIGDINNDGKYTDEDKEIIINICEKELIKDKGGLGKYPGTRVVHMDVRGYKARWNTY